MSAVRIFPTSRKRRPSCAFPALAFAKATRMASRSPAKARTIRAPAPDLTKSLHRFQAGRAFYPARFRVRTPAKLGELPDDDRHDRHVLADDRPCLSGLHPLLHAVEAPHGRGCLRRSRSAAVQGKP